MKSIRIGKSITNRDETSLNLYLKDVSKEPLITTEEEALLAQRIREGDKEALNKLVKANLRFAISVAKQYQNRGLPLNDLISEANLGLIKAAEKFDETKGFKFISYAVWWIRQSILQALADKGRTVRLPLNQVSIINRINRVSSEFEQRNERAPSMEELEEELDIPSEKISSIISAATKCVSVDTPFKDDEEGCLLDVIPNEDSPSADSNVMSAAKSKEIDLLLQHFTLREQVIIKLFFGLGVQEMSLEDIGKKFGITSERIRQIKEKVLKEIREKYYEQANMLR